MKNLQLFAAAAVFVGFIPLSSHAQVLVSYAYPPKSSAATPPAPTVTNDSTYASGSTTTGSGVNLTDNGFIPGYLTEDPVYPQSLGAAVSDANYFSFTVTPGSGDEVSLTSFDLSLTSLYSSDNASTFVLESSVTGFGTTTANMLATYSSTTNGTPVPLGTKFVDLTTPVEFRLYDYGSANYQYAALQNGPLNIDGVATPAVGTVPEPSTLALFGFGAAALAFVVRRKRLV